MKARNERRLGFAVMGLRPKPRDLTHWGPGEGLRRPAKKKGGTKSASPFPRSPVRRSGCVPAEPYPPCGPGKNNMSSGFAVDFLREAFLNHRVPIFPVVHKTGAGVLTYKPKAPPADMADGTGRGKEVDHRYKDLSMNERGSRKQ